MSSTTENRLEWRVDPEPVSYPDALAAMDERAAAIREGAAPELVWLLEHPPLYTAGTSSKNSGLFGHADIPVYKSGRGGEHTYHGPGQRITYVMLDLKKRQQAPDIKHYVWQLEEWLIRTLALLSVRGERRAGRVGIWVVDGQGGEAKIAAIGVRIRRWVTMHGVSLNIDPDLSHYVGIVPCGIREYGVTSLAKLLGKAPDMAEVDKLLRQEWDGVFG